MPQLGIGLLNQSRNWAVEFDLIVVLALGEDRHLVEVFGEPGCGFGDMDKAVLDHRGLRMQPHDLVAFRLVAGDAMAALGDQLLDQLGAGGLVLDQHDSVAWNRLCCSRTARLSSGYSSRRRNTPSR